MNGAMCRGRIGPSSVAQRATPPATRARLSEHVRFPPTGTDVSADRRRLRVESGGNRALAEPLTAFRVYETAGNRAVSFDELIATAAKADIVFFGEQHDDPETHFAEFALLEGIGRVRPRVIVSLEMFERDVQPVIDDYLADRISEAEFLAKSRPWDRYATDYRGLVQLARARGWPVVASNIPRPLASAIGRKGLAALDTLTPSQRTWAATQLACPKDKYYENFAETMKGHGGPGTAADSAAARTITDRFYEAQCAKDETMGESIARALNAAPGAIVVHYNGAFHSDFGLGPPSAPSARPGCKDGRGDCSAGPDADVGVAGGSRHTRGICDLHQTHSGKVTKIVVPDDFPLVFAGSDAEAQLRALGDVIVHSERGAEDEAALIERIREADAVVNLRAYAKFTERVVAACPNLRLISVWGTGVDHIDHAACQARGVAVANTPGVNAHTVAEHTMALMLSFARRIPWNDGLMRAASGRAACSWSSRAKRSASWGSVRSVVAWQRSPRCSTCGSWPIRRAPTMVARRASARTTWSSTT